MEDDEDEESAFDIGSEQPPHNGSRGIDSDLSSGKDSSPIPALAGMPARTHRFSNSMRQKIIQNLNDARRGDTMLGQGKDFSPATSSPAAEGTSSMRRGRDSLASGASWSLVPHANNTDVVATKIAMPFILAKQRVGAGTPSGANGSPTSSAPARSSGTLRTSRWGPIVTTI